MSDKDINQINRLNPEEILIVHIKRIERAGSEKWQQIFFESRQKIFTPAPRRVRFWIESIFLFLQK
jgi:hypothetical protein